MNKQGQVWAYGLMLGLVIIVLAMALSPPLNDFTKTAMNQTTGDTIGLDCTNSSISNFQKGACVVTDFSIAYFIGGIILIGGTLVLAKIVFT